MSLTFNHATKRIGVPQADAAPLLIQQLINAIRAEEASERGIAYPQIADAAGKNSLGGAVETGITVKLRSTWALEFEAGAYQAAVDGGNLAEALDRVVNTGSPQVLFLSSAAATLVTGGGGGTAPTAGQNATAVWERVLEAGFTAEQLIRVMAAVLAGKVSGAGTGVERFRAIDDSKDRVVSNTDAAGNRSSVTVDGS